MPPTTFAENVVLITGASSGIGRALALQLAAQGAWLALAARREAALAQAAAECAQIGGPVGGRVWHLPTDVSEETQCRRLVAQTINQYGRVDTLINNAGMTMWARFDELQNLKLLETILRINYLGSVYCTDAALPYLKCSRGRIVVVSSLAGKTGVPLRSGYAASKHALVGFFDSLRIELAESGVSVTLAYPDFVATETRLRAYGPDGYPLGASPVQEGQVMTAETCARLILRAAAGRKREVIMSLRGRVGQWLRLLAPGLIDRIARQAIEKGR